MSKSRDVTTLLSDSPHQMLPSLFGYSPKCDGKDERNIKISKKIICDTQQPHCNKVIRF